MSGLMMPAPDAQTLRRRDEIVADMRIIVPGEGVVDQPTGMRVFESDGLTAYRQLPLVVVLPETVREFADRYLDGLAEPGRALVPGVATAKFAGNYAASLLAQAQASDEGCDQVVWLDAIERRYVEEMGGMNLFFVFGSGPDARLVTPSLSGSLLPGITRNSLLALAADSGFAVEERKISTDEWRTKCKSGEITEVFACGTAAVITPVGRVKSAEGEFTIADGEPGEVTMALRDTLTGIQRGTFADTHGWMTKLH